MASSGRSQLTTRLGSLLLIGDRRVDVAVDEIRHYLDAAGNVEALDGLSFKYSEMLVTPSLSWMA